MYIIDMAEDMGGTPEAIVMEVGADGQTFSGKVYVTYTVAE
jgi:hypothetical protein